MLEMNPVVVNASSLLVPNSTVYDQQKKTVAMIVVKDGNAVITDIKEGLSANNFHRDIWQCTHER